LFHPLARAKSPGFGEIHVPPMERPISETLVLRSPSASEENAMNAWSEYLRGQAALADRISKSQTDPATIREFANYAEGFRQDADAEDKTPVHIRENRSVQ
jgi:hypothetical protein